MATLNTASDQICKLRRNVWSVWCYSSLGSSVLCYDLLGSLIIRVATLGEVWLTDPMLGKQRVNGRKKQEEEIWLTPSSDSDCLYHNLFKRFLLLSPGYHSGRPDIVCELNSETLIPSFPSWIFFCHSCLMTSPVRGKWVMNIIWHILFRSSSLSLSLGLLAKFPPGFWQKFTLPSFPCWHYSEESSKLMPLLHGLHMSIQEVGESPLGNSTLSHLTARTRKALSPWNGRVGSIGGSISDIASRSKTF